MATSSTESVNQTRVRGKRSYNTLEEIITALSCNPHSNLVWVGKDYSKADLINDLTRIAGEQHGLEDSQNVQV